MVGNDYDGDGKADVVVYLASSVDIRPSGGGADRVIPFGTPGRGRSIPISGDYDDDGKLDLAVYLPAIAAFGFRQAAAAPT